MMNKKDYEFANALCLGKRAGWVYTDCWVSPSGDEFSEAEGNAIQLNHYNSSDIISLLKRLVRASDHVCGNHSYSECNPRVGLCCYRNILREIYSKYPECLAPNYRPPEEL